MSAQTRSKNTQFKKGQSGNPRGRPKQAKRPKSLGFLFRKVAQEQVRLEIDGDAVTMLRWSAYVNQIYTMALNKDIAAARLLDQLRRQFPGDPLPGDKITFGITEADERL
ncbi:DUF5681 domain-containing protein [Bradyrhizobium sp. 2S1]|uniref:DUF5681 domain-containing protein n=1 Tax=Bradyrhizobium sp. 2S1 TaxID=1404429 RepID=UPI0014094C5D|nr:DUF5681 domain-containing protein [Bradyrhizobium sp. 2S1]MCK7670946.1 DUF5681 domain-containing protein [Bradyrhizobium sp. 2S1]